MMALTRSPYKSRFGIRRVYHAMTYSYAGIQTAWQQEAAFRQISWLNFILIPISLCLNLSQVEHILLIAVSMLAWIVELINSAIEAVVDRISLEQHVLSKQAKDQASAAQSITLLLILLTWLMIVMAHVQF